MTPTAPADRREDWSALYRYAVSQLARREHSRQELRTKLIRKFTGPPDKIEQLLDKLVEQNDLSDSRFAESYLRYRSSRGFGRERIGRELLDRGVDDALVRHILDRAGDYDWLGALRNTWQKKFKHPPMDFSERTKQMRFLLYRGFTRQQVQQLFQQLKDGAE